MCGGVVVSLVCWGVVLLGVRRPTCCAMLEALLLLGVVCVCCVWCNSGLRWLCWGQSVWCSVCGVAGVGRVLRACGAHSVWLKARWACAASRGVARVCRRGWRAADLSGPHGSVPLYR